MSADINSEDPVQINALRTFPASTKDFTGISGTTYYIEDALSIERYKAYQRLEIELGFGYNFAALFDKVKICYERQNERKFADVSVILYQVMEGAMSVKEKRPIALYMASLFINKADEDRGVWNATIAEEKFKDWADIDASFFLLVALGRVRSLQRITKSISQLLEAVGEVDLKIMGEEMTDEEQDQTPFR